MSKQTINIGASPNDGTGTPLRTSFDYTNQNFTELYTAVGPSGNNIVVPGNATITGDLTVRTNKLKVDATGVGIGTTSPTSGTLTVQTHYLLFPDSQTKIGDNGFCNGAASDGNTQIQFFGGKSLFFNEGASNTKMTLNSTGLGIGKTPAARLDVGSARAASVVGGIIGTTGTGVVADECQFLIKNVNTASGQNNGAGIGGLLEASASNKSSLLFYVDNGTSTVNVGRFDSNGNMINLIQASAPTLVSNSTFVWNLTSNTNLRVSVRGTDGVTRTGNITLA